MVRSKFYTPNEVSIHNTMEDLWVSFLGKVYNLTPLCQKFKAQIIFIVGRHGQISTAVDVGHVGDILLKPILQAGGTDMSHWFNPKTKDIRTHVDPQTGCTIAYTPHGRFLHIPPPCPSNDWANDFGRAWWRDDCYCIGTLSKKTRFIRVINTLTSQEQVIEVCGEETMKEILDRYLMYNSHAGSYTWKYDGRNLDMGTTLEENSIPDEDEEFYRLGMSDDLYLQAIHLYFNDDLTEA